MIAEAVYTILTGATDVTATATGGIHPVRAKETTANPCIVYNIQTDVENDKDGYATIRYHYLQLDIYADIGTGGYNDANRLKEYCRQALDRYSGTLNDVVIDTILFESTQDLYDDRAGSYRIMCDYRIREKFTEDASDGIGVWIIGTTFIVQ